MHRLATFSGLLLALSAPALPAWAQMGNYCGGALVVDSYVRQMPPGTGLAIFDGRLRNVSGQPKTFQITILAPLQPSVSAPITLGARGSRMIDFTQAVPSGTEALTGQQAARYVRITCQ